jgi:quercetin dioxygenase-like cupin family protein
MKTTSLLHVAIAAAVVCAFQSTVHGQDPAKVNSSTVRVKFENERVRVLEANLPAGKKEEMHSHPACIIYAVEGGRFRNYTPDGKTSEAELKTGEVIYREPLTHAAENIGAQAAHLILVELKDAGAGGVSPQK